MEVKDDNPYSRLMALKRMGVVENYEEIRKYAVIVVGIGGVGLGIDQNMLSASTYTKHLQTAKAKFGARKTSGNRLIFSRNPSRLSRD